MAVRCRARAGRTICEVCRPVRSPERFPRLGDLASQGLPAGTGGILGLDRRSSRWDDRSNRCRRPFIRRRPGPDRDLSGRLRRIWHQDRSRHPAWANTSRRHFATFEFDDADSLIAALNACMREGVVSRAFALDRLKSQQAKRVDVNDAISTGVAVLRRSNHFRPRPSRAALIFLSSRRRAGAKGRGRFISR